MAERKHYDITVEGQVQGVSFRAAVRSEAERLGVAGTVRNQPGGSVRIEAEGDEEALKQLVAWCGHGPALAEVSRVTVTEGGWQGWRGFEIV